MRWLISTSLHLRVAVLVLAGLLVFFGLSEVRRAPLDVFPEFAPPLVEIQTEAPGLSTTEVESLISSPIENAVNGVIGLKTLRSRSVLGLSSVVLDSGRQCRSAQDSATGAGTAGDRQFTIACGIQTSRHPFPAVVNQPCPEDRAFIQDANAG